METTIRVIDSVVSRAAYVEYNLRLSKALRKDTVWVWAAALMALALVFNTYAFLVEHKSFPLFPYAMAGVLVLAYVRVPAILRSRFEKIYDKTPSIGAKINFLLTPTDTVLAHGEFSWASFIGAVAHKQWLMLHSGNRTFSIIDTNQIQSPATVADVYALLEQHNIPLGMEKVKQALSLTK